MSIITEYKVHHRMLIAVDCIILGFDGKDLKALLVKRGFEPGSGNWSLMGGFVKKEESVETAAFRILEVLTGITNIYLEQLYTFGEVERDPGGRVVSIAYFALIDIHQYEKQLSEDFHAEWFSLKKIPKLIFDHSKMVKMAQEKLRYKAAFHPILFELLPEKFTLPQLRNLYEGIYNAELDKRNFIRKIRSTRLLVKQKEKEKESSKKGAYYYKLDKRRYNSNFNSFLNFIPNPHKLK